MLKKQCMFAVRVLLPVPPPCPRQSTCGNFIPDAMVLAGGAGGGCQVWRVAPREWDWRPYERDQQAEPPQQDGLGRR